MSVNLICFSWNTDNIPLCQDYLNNNTSDIIDKPGGLFSKSSRCLNPSFFITIEDYIIKYNPFMVVITTENEVNSGSLFHNDFLPKNMNRLNYRLLVNDNYESSNDKNRLMMSIYMRNDETRGQVLEFNKGYIFNDNKILCGDSRSKAMCLYIKTYYGNFAFVGVQMNHNYKQQQSCIQNIIDKFITGKRRHYTFIMGDFANTYNPTKNDLSNYELINKIREHDSYVFDKSSGKYKEGVSDYVENTENSVIGMNLSYSPKVEGNKKFVVPSYSPNYKNTFVNNNITNNTMSTYEELANSKLTEQNQVTIGYHDKIFYSTGTLKDENNIRELKCLDYSSVLGSPMLMKGIYNGDHLGTIGVYEIPVLPKDQADFMWEWLI